MADLGTCRLCQAGPLQRRRCGVCRRVVVLCDECDAAWPTKNTLGPPTLTTGAAMPCPGCRADLFANGSRWVEGE